MRSTSFAVLLSVFFVSSAARASGEASDGSGREWELGGSAVSTFGPLEHESIGESDWPLYPGGGIEGGLRLSPYVALGIGVDAFVRDLAGFFEPLTTGSPLAMRDRGHVTTFMPTARLTLSLPFRGGPFAVTGRYAVGAAIDRRYEPCLWLAQYGGCVYPDRVFRWTALAQTLTAGLRVAAGRRGYLHVEGGFLALFYPRPHPAYRDPPPPCVGYRCLPSTPNPRFDSDGFRPGGIVRIAGGVTFGARALTRGTRQ